MVITCKIIVYYHYQYIGINTLISFHWSQYIDQSSDLIQIAAVQARENSGLDQGFSNGDRRRGQLQDVSWRQNWADLLLDWVWASEKETGIKDHFYVFG